jgi:cytochrome c heme-lyase
MSCPVDDNARQEWLAKHGSPPHPFLPSLSSSPSIPSPSAASHSSTFTYVTTPTSLSKERETSSIPRHSPPSASEPNWVYPSPDQFYRSLINKRKDTSVNPETVNTIIPIHNAVNERVWEEILKWEGVDRGQGDRESGGRKLIDFKGKSKELSPRARWRSWIGWVFLREMRGDGRICRDLFVIMGCTRKEYFFNLSDHSWDVELLIEQVLWSCFLDNSSFLYA